MPGVRVQNELVTWGGLEHPQPGCCWPLLIGQAVCHSSWFADYYLMLAGDLLSCFVDNIHDEA